MGRKHFAEEPVAFALRQHDSGQPATPPMIHQGLTRATFSPDGRFLFSSGRETVQVWVSATGEPLSPPLAASGAQWHLSDSRLMIFPHKTGWATTNKTPLVWDLKPIGGPAERLSILTEILAAGRVNRTGAIAYLDSRSLRKAWSVVKAGADQRHYKASDPKRLD